EGGGWGGGQRWGAGDGGVERGGGGGGEGGLGAEAGGWCGAELLGRFERHQQHRGGAVRDLARVARCDGVLGIERGLQRRRGLIACVGADALVAAEDLVLAV